MEFERPDIIRPPSEHDSYFLPVTSGCSNNVCTFCGAYYAHKLRMRELDDVKKEIDAMALYLHHGVRLTGVDDLVYMLLSKWDEKKVFLQDGDALVYPVSKLKESLEYLNSKFPDLERTGAYATPQDILRRSVDELVALKKHKLNIIYMGVESGDDEVLKNVCKGATHDQMVEAGRKVKQAGIILSVTVILGLAGLEGSEKHAIETARALSEMDPEYAGALTLMLVPETPLHNDYVEGKFKLISPFDTLKELRLMIERSDFTDCFFSSVHASNYFNLKGRLPHEKARLLRELEAILAKQDPKLLRPEFLRGL